MNNAYDYIIVGAGSSGATLAARLTEDASCRAHGTEGLRVIDPSIMPAVPRADTHLACVMIGELMADRLKNATG